MATLLRRAVSLRSLALLRNSRNSINLSFLSSLASYEQSLSSSASLPCLRGFGRLELGFRTESQRGFAKGRKSKVAHDDDDDDDDSGVKVDPNIGPTVKATALAQMDAAIVALSRELCKLRTGRAAPGMLDHIIVDTNGVKTPLPRIAVVSVVDSQNLSVTPYDPNTLKELEHAIASSPLGLSPRQDGQRLVAAIPPLTKEHIQAMSKLVSKSAEDVKQSIRRARQKALDSIKKAASSIPKDDAKRLEKEVEEMTKKFVKSADDMCKAKEKEIMGK
ncbi:hypothetical protein H6P81_013275 [Aristolochia fimbriata]|uniref:Ribosome-recycling factor, chloroplastic n=1 Tax=Aristolochia fimbriata TaxID=158543 RepID=A0AAV7EHW6_ARIFI|nr:hypothetical protein H6P81_013275 [Aristolochia fimbriata]